MAGVSSGQRRPVSAARRRQQAARHRKYLRRRITLGVVLLGLLIGAYFGVDWALSRWLGKAGEPAATTTTQLGFEAAILIPAGDLDGDNKPEQVAVGPTQGAVRKIALVTGAKKPYSQIGAAFEVPAAKLEIRDLPGSKGVLVLSGNFATTGEPKKVEVPGGGTATEAAGGEPFFQAWRLDKAKGLVSDDFYALAAPTKPATDIVVDKWLNVLWFYRDGKLSATYRVATGKYLDGPAPAAVNQDKNYVTPLGKYAITNLQVNPKYNKTGIAGGDPKNPLGTRFMGFSVYSGDNAGVWA
ncbi:MAG TPA: L,D-transpeptidase, partial [Symbiobacteriaceae bacterium]|nr:L,D-transpeptidase [Symbiobacteriaceae bacterium]